MFAACQIKFAKIHVLENLYFFGKLLRVQTRFVNGNAFSNMARFEQLIIKTKSTLIKKNI